MILSARQSKAKQSYQRISNRRSAGTLISKESAV
jgi:hypothetical protein